MPAQPLFDLSHVDLSELSLTRGDIARVNPHRGDMVQLDGIYWHDPEFKRAVGVKFVRGDEFWASGHIPGKPLLPGVLMIEAAAQLSSFLYYRRSGSTVFSGFTRIEDTAFRGIVVPGDDLVILSDENKYNPKRFITRVQGLVRGDVVFEGTITGMAFPGMGEMHLPPVESRGSRPMAHH